MGPTGLVPNLGQLPLALLYYTSTSAGTSNILQDERIALNHLQFPYTTAKAELELVETHTRLSKQAI